MSAPIGKTSGGNAAYKNYNNQFAHISDPNERRRLALAEIDKAPFGWYHIRAIVVAGVGFFTDSYDIFAINLVTAMFGLVYWTESNKGVIPDSADTAIKVSTSGGTVIGQLLFGWLADVVGRKKMYGLELMVIIIGTLGQTLSSDSPSIHIVGIIIFWRVFMGIGIGGDYPLSSIITSEFATTKWRGAVMGSVFAMQGFGQFTAALVALIVTVAFGKHLKPFASPADCDVACQAAVDRMWRIIIGFGAVPACIALYYRLTIPETPRYTFDIARDVEKATADAEAYTAGVREGTVGEIHRIETLRQADTELVAPKASWNDFIHHYGQWKNGKVLLGTAGSWFLLDVAFYGLGLNNSVILSAIGFSNKGSVYNRLKNAAVGNLILVCAGAIPGYWMTVATVDTIGRKPIQIGGFTVLTILFCIIGFAFHKLSAHGLLALYVLCQFFFNFGPNATTFIVPGECFPTRYRSTSHGMSAAAGKVGAIIAQVLIGPLRTKGHVAPPPGAKSDPNPSPWLNHVMQIFAFFMFVGIFTSFLIPETKRKTLEQLCGEDTYSEDAHPHGVQEERLGKSGSASTPPEELSKEH